MKPRPKRRGAKRRPACDRGVAMSVYVTRPTKAALKQLSRQTKTTPGRIIDRFMADRIGTAILLGSQSVTTESTHSMRTQTEVRDSFWESHPQFIPLRRATKRQNSYPCDVRMAFCDYIDSLRRDDGISESLAGRVTL